MKYCHVGTEDDVDRGSSLSSQRPTRDPPDLMSETRRRTRERRCFREDTQLGPARRTRRYVIATKQQQKTTTTTTTRNGHDKR
ncbi:hypothetical protein F2P81_016955 [Scophthalmus maximus]|uniref:Uncharacterized protein n=1 Tax=Scophthalmus maximus TaxID=52904 RepID=A0A6A4SH16_SCOMX|nr:hypothetical protein F2P81_016955 [Scophthalmus maximus]